MTFRARPATPSTQFFDAGWIDAPVRPDKRHGAFCATNVPGVHPYVFMNYTGDRRSILTLAHELGHALHGTMAQPLGLFNASTPLTTAETASVFGEALTFKRLLALRTIREAARPAHGPVEDAIATTFRQIAMNRFENLVHTERREQGELASDRLNELWIECQSALFGDSVGVDGYETWWSYVPHFLNTPGYVYAYAYGYLFALAIFRSYQRQGDAMVAPYLDLLRAGGSKAPEDLARMVGLDLSESVHLGERDRGIVRRARRGRSAGRGDRAGLTEGLPALPVGFAGRAVALEEGRARGRELRRHLCLELGEIGVTDVARADPSCHRPVGSESAPTSRALPFDDRERVHRDERAEAQPVVVEQRQDLGLEELSHGRRELGCGRDGRSRRSLDQVEQLVLHLGREPAEDRQLDAPLLAAEVAASLRERPDRPLAVAEHLPDEQLVERESRPVSSA